MAWNNVCEVKPRVKVNLSLVNPWVILHMEQLTLKKTCCLQRECAATIHGTMMHTDCLTPTLDSTMKHH